MSVAISRGSTKFRVQEPPQGPVIGTAFVFEGHVRLYGRERRFLRLKPQMKVFLYL